MNTQWTKLSVECKTEETDTVSAILSMVANSLMVEDYSDLEEAVQPGFGELIDEELLKKDKTKATVSVFLPPEKNPAEDAAFVRERLRASGLACPLAFSGVDEEDWANEWKKYYHPQHIGKHLVVTPPWENYAPAAGETVVTMDPGMAFGTGTHETTRLCLALLESYLPEKIAENPRLRLLDVGTGSGILSIAASKLGAEACYAYDIDPVAVRVAKENAAANGCGNITCGCSDLLAGVNRDAPYDFVCANIVADIILRMAPDLPPLLRDGAIVITSGVIAPRAEEVLRGMEVAGFEKIGGQEENDWTAMVFRKQAAKI